MLVWSGMPVRNAVRAVLVFLGFAMAAGSPPPAAAGDQPRVEATRIGAHGQTARFVLETDRPVPYSVFLLDNPYRAVIDLPEIAWRAEPGSVAAGNALIARYRSGLFRPGTSRVVIDLKAPARVEKLFRLGPDGDAGHRLVLDLAPVDPGAFVASRRAESDDWASARAERRATPAPTQTPAPPRTDGRRVVVVDPGHGGVDPGAIGAGGTYEKEVVLGASKVLRRALEATGRYRVVLTRDRDVYLPLRDRYQVAHEAGADLFLSIHADSIRSGKVRGLSVYTLSNTASDAEAAALAASENKSDVLAGYDLTGYEDVVSSILIDLAATATVNNSRALADMMVGTLNSRVRLLTRPHRQAGFAVLKSPTVPSVLVEMGFLSNRQDETMLLSDDYRRAVAQGIVEAVDRFFERQDRLSRT